MAIEGLQGEVRRCIAVEDDAALYGALDAAPGQAVYRALWDAIRAVVEAFGTDGVDVVARPFAIPIVFVAGSRRPIIAPGPVTDIGEVLALLERHGAVGTTRNVGLGAELVPLEALERLLPSRVHRWHAEFTDGGIGGMKGAPIEIAPGREQAHLRFLLGAGIARAHLPSFLETAADIGRWGALFTRALARQLAQDGLELLPLARPPQLLLDAGHHGRHATLDIAFQLFASHAIRACRMSAGEPTVIVSAHREERAAEVRISVSALLDDALLEGFRWPLHPMDDMDEIGASIAEWLDACRVADARWLPQVVSGPLPDAGAAFIPVREFDRVTATLKRH